MKKTMKNMLTAICCTGVLAVGYVNLVPAQAPAAAQSDAAESKDSNDDAPQSPTILVGGGQQEDLAGPGTGQQAAALDMIRIWGPVLGVEEGVIRIDNQSGTSYAGEIVLNISDDYSRVLDAQNGYPAGLDTIQAGDFIYAYIGPAMTMSLPPMTTAEMVICQVPEDFRAPDYVRVKAMQENADGSWTLTATDDAVYQVPSDCQLLPYLTRNIVRLSDVAESSTCLIWTDAAGSVQKIVLFAQDSE